MKQILRRPGDLVIWAFTRALPVVNWGFLIVGLAGAVGTVAGLLPPFNKSWWAKVTTILLWLLFAREGYEPIAEQREEAQETNVRPWRESP